jgi:hypothetical protein
MIRPTLLALGVTMVIGGFVPCYAQGPVIKNYPPSYFPQNYPSSYFPQGYPTTWASTPRQAAGTPGGFYPHTWQPAYPLSQPQVQAWNYWYRSALVPYLYSTGNLPPGRP